MVRRLVASLALVAVLGALSAGAAAPAARVVGGTATQIQSAPWSVFIAYVSGSTEYDCTGAVIDASHVLTAAHCFFDRSGVRAQPAQVSVEAGVSNFLSPIATDRRQDRSVSAVRVHPGYVFAEAEVPDDVAVLTLAVPLDLSGSAVQAVALPAAGAPFPAGATVATAGYGLEVGTAQDVTGALESMTATVDPQGQCGEITRDPTIQTNNAVVLCASSPTSSICNGDSGGALVTTGGTPVLVGVVNDVVANCPIGSRGIFAYVAVPELLSFMQGSDQPPAAPRATAATSSASGGVTPSSSATRSRARPPGGRSPSRSRTRSSTPPAERCCSRARPRAIRSRQALPALRSSAGSP